MIVRVEMDRMGCVRVVPDAVRWLKRFQQLLKSGGARGGDANGYLFLQGDAGEEFISELKPAQQRDIREGWQVKLRMDEWTFGQMLGYDCGDRLATA